MTDEIFPAGPDHEAMRTHMLFEELVESALVGIYISTVSGQILYANSAMRRLFGYESAEEFSSVNVAQLYWDPGVRREVTRIIQERGHISGQEVDVRTKQELRKRVLINASFSEGRIAGMLLDITEKRAAEDALRRVSERATTTNRMARIGSWGKDLLTGEDEWCEVTREIHEVGPDFVPTMENSLSFYKEGPSRDQMIELVKRCIETGTPYDVEVEFVTAKGNELWIRTMGQAEFRDGQCVRLFGTFQDITDRKRAELRLQYLSTHDPLTGVHNRGYFDEELARLSRGRRFPVTVVMADVNHLKIVNDTSGHTSGDQVLRCASAVLRESVRGEDVVARIGGDEFAIILPETDEQAALNVVRRIRKGLSEHCCEHDHPPLQIAVGVATAAVHESLEAAMRLADSRMYEDKRWPGNRELGG